MHGVAGEVGCQFSLPLGPRDHSLLTSLRSVQGIFSSSCLVCQQTAKSTATGTGVGVGHRAKQHQKAVQSWPAASCVSRPQYGAVCPECPPDWGPDNETALCAEVFFPLDGDRRILASLPGVEGTGGPVANPHPLEQNPVAQKRPPLVPRPDMACVLLVQPPVGAACDTSWQKPRRCSQLFCRLISPHPRGGGPSASSRLV